MNLIKFLESFTDDKLYATGTSRRNSFSQFGNLGKGLALASLPFGLSALSNKAFAADITPTPATAAGALQLALTLEYLESAFYATAVDSAGLIPAEDQAAITLIRDHEADHVSFLTTAMEANGIAIPAMPTFDFSGGIGLDPFNNYDQFLAVAQAFEDTGVRAYKGQAGYLMGSDFLTAALQIHSVEARHASQIRRMRGQKGWITLNNSGGLPPQVQVVYDGEESTALGAGQFDAAAQSEAYDETISTQTAVNIANLFIV
ncbi:ferritin-like domain-containing protein [Flavobacterium sp. MAH-1]|uniref:Ferritin-like domain-containing protein n=1 Tax=Flavobacterium agri TaxID=2743471 RepID=A0A7Y8Y303_9FLAO|nr:ferritin-like domain-containing protein [Flavobacterium agri]NUY81567.1 ferritin-like domain-containing protein [Flavobacterium agri]NYA71591.1 ferritin-like domain-containing protein [Flavobacterium agri]